MTDRIDYIGRIAVPGGYIRVFVADTARTDVHIASLGDLYVYSARAAREMIGINAVVIGKEDARSLEIDAEKKNAFDRLQVLYWDNRSGVRVLTATFTDETQDEHDARKGGRL